MKKTILFRKASFKHTIKKKKLSHFNNYRFAISTGRPGFLSNKQLECLRVTVSRLCKSNVSYWNTKNYLSTFDSSSILSNSLFESNNFPAWKSHFVSSQRNKKRLLNFFHKKKSKKKTKKKNLSLKKQSKQKDIFFRIVRKKIDYLLFNKLDTRFVKRSNKSRMGKGKSKVDMLMKKINKNDFLFLFKHLDAVRIQQVISQLNHKTNLNLFFSQSKHGI